MIWPPYASQVPWLTFVRLMIGMGHCCLTWLPTFLCWSYSQTSPQQDNLILDFQNSPDWQDTDFWQKIKKIPTCWPSEGHQNWKGRVMENKKCSFIQTDHGKTTYIAYLLWVHLLWCLWKYCSVTDARCSIFLLLIPETQKPKNIPDSGFLRANFFRTKRADSLFATCQKNA